MSCRQIAINFHYYYFKNLTNYLLIICEYDENLQSTMTTLPPPLSFWSLATVYSFLWDGPSDLT